MSGLYSTDCSCLMHLILILTCEYPFVISYPMAAPTSAETWPALSPSKLASSISVIKTSAQMRRTAFNGSANRHWEAWLISIWCLNLISIPLITLPINSNLCVYGLRPGVVMCCNLKSQYHVSITQILMSAINKLRLHPWMLLSQSPPEPPASHFVGGYDLRLTVTCDQSFPPSDQLAPRRFICRNKKLPISDLAVLVQ